MRRFGWASWVLFAAVVGLSFGPRFVLPVILPEHVSPWWEPLQHLVLLAALICNVLVYGRNRAVVPWPSILATLYLAGTLLLATRIHATESSAWEMNHALAAWLVLSLPWLCGATRLQPGSIRGYAAVLGSLAALSALFGLVLDFSGDWWSFSLWKSSLYRFQGATRGDYFAGFAFGGVIIAVHEWNRRAGRGFGALATLSAILLILSGSRTAIIVTGAWVLCYLALSSGFRARVSRFNSRLWFAVGGVVVAFLLYLPVLRLRMAGLRSGELNLSGREDIWAEFFALFRASPWLGHGLGVAQPGVTNAWFPHNEYLRLLVELGIVGAGLYLLGAGIWIHRVRIQLLPEDRPFLISLIVALGFYALTDNPISACYITPFIYVGALLSASASPGTQPSAASSR